jgi:hypothetical protein
MSITESPAGHETFDVVAAVFNLGEVLYRSTADSMDWGEICVVGHDRKLAGTSLDQIHRTLPRRGSRVRVPSHPPKGHDTTVLIPFWCTEHGPPEYEPVIAQARRFRCEH